MGLFRKIVSQTRKPQGFLGKMMVSGMNDGHARTADWGISHLATVEAKDILEVGCGGGRNAYELLRKYPDSKLTAIDYSDVSLAKTKAYNADMISAGRCEVEQGDVSSLKYHEQYDLATAFETIYFWPGLEKCFAEVNKALRPGGKFMICNESDGRDKAGLHFESIIDGMKCHTLEEIEDALIRAGFSSVKADHHESKPWITVIAEK